MQIAVVTDSPLRTTFRGRVAAGAAANAVRQLINIIGQIALLPLLLVFWGAERYGEWQLLSAAVGYMALLDFGMQTYVVNRMGQCFIRGDMQEFIRVFHSALGFALGACVLTIGILVPAVIAAPLDRWFDLNATGVTGGKIVSCLLMTQMAVLLPNGVLAGVYRATGEYARDVSIANVYRVVLLVLTVLTVMAGGELVAVAVLQLILVLIVIAYITADIGRRHPDIRVGISKVDRNLVVSFIGPSLLFLLLQMSTAISAHGSTLIIGAAFGAGSVAVYATIRALVNLIPQTTGAISAALWPELTMMQATGRCAELNRIHRLAAKTIMMIALAAAVWLHFVGRDVVALWTGDRIQYDQALMDACALFQIAAAMHLMSSVLLGSSNNHKALAICRVLSSGVGLALGAWLVRPFGASGCVLGMLIADVVFSGVLIPVMACKLISATFASFALDVWFRSAVVGLTIYAATYRALTAVPVNGSGLRLLVSTSVILGASLVSGYLFLLSASDKEHVRRVIGGLSVRLVHRARNSRPLTSLAP